MIKITTFVITYNQEKYIRDTIESVVNQCYDNYELIISDDCSTDSTVSVILECIREYGNKIKLISQPFNLGINANYNYVLQINPESEIVNILDGDDYYMPGLFHELNQIYMEKNLNGFEQKFIIIPNIYKMLSSGELTPHINSYKYRFHNKISLRVRDLIGSRMTGFSAQLYREINKFNLELGLWADALFAFDFINSADKVYFSDKYYPVYRIGSGVNQSEGESRLSVSAVKVYKFILKHRSRYLTVYNKIYIMKIILKFKINQKYTYVNGVFYILLHILTIFDVLIGYFSFIEYLYRFSPGIPHVVLNKVKKLKNI